MRLLVKLATIAAAAVPAVAVGTTTTVHATSGLGCTASSTYGTTCEKVFGTGLQVTDVAAYFIPPNNNFFGTHAWTFELTAYHCAPYGLTKSQCPPYAKYYGNSRTGEPPKQGTQCSTISAQFGSGSFEYQDCVDYGEAQSLATHGDWPSYHVPVTYGQTTYLCSEIAVKVGTSWVDNGPAGSKGYRACQTVHA